MTLINNRVLGSYKRYPNDGIRQLFAAILRVAWEDASKTLKADKKNITIGEIHEKRIKSRDIDLARQFLMGNYSREMLEICCKALDISPNYLIKKASQCSWAKDITPRYFKYD